MNWQEIIVIALVIVAVAYLIRYFIKMNQTHNCSECGLMKMKKESDQIQNVRS